MNKWQAIQFSNVDTVVTWKRVKMFARTLGKSQDEEYEEKSLFLAFGVNTLRMLVICLGVGKQ